MRPNESEDYFGAYLIYVALARFTLGIRAPVSTADLKPEEQDLGLLEFQYAAANGPTGKEIAEIKRVAPAANTTKYGEGDPLLARSELVSTDIQVSPQDKLSAPLKAIKDMLATASADLTSATALLDAQITQADDASAEVTTVDSLQTELAAQTKAKTEAKIKKEITADEATAVKYADHDDNDYKHLKKAKANLATLESDIQQALNALKA